MNRCEEKQPPGSQIISLDASVGPLGLHSKYIKNNLFPVVKNSTISYKHLGLGLKEETCLINFLVIFSYLLSSTS